MARPHGERASMCGRQQQGRRETTKRKREEDWAKDYGVERQRYTIQVRYMREGGTCGEADVTTLLPHTTGFGLHARCDYGESQASLLRTVSQT